MEVSGRYTLPDIPCHTTPTGIIRWLAVLVHPGDDAMLVLLTD